MAQSNLATGDRPAGKGASETSDMVTPFYEISLSREDNARLLEVARFLNKVLRMSSSNPCWPPSSAPSPRLW